MTLSLDLLKTFVRVAELKSFSAAADEAGVARGVVSKRIAQLEAAVGQPVLARSTRRVELTPAGELLVDTLRRAIDDIELGFVAVQELRALPSGVVRVTAPVSWGQCWLCPRIPRFLDMHPHIEVELVLSDSLMDLASERYDLGFRMTGAPDQNLVAISLEALTRHLCATTAYLRKHGEPSHPRDLAAHATMTYWSPTLQEPLRFEKAGEVITIASRGRFRANSPDAILAAVLAGSSMGVLPTYASERELAGGKLKVVLPEWKVKSRLGERIFAVGTPDRMRLARCKALVEFVRRELAP